jgi:hypothetical protein
MEISKKQSGDLMTALFGNSFGKPSPKSNAISRHTSAESIAEGTNELTEPQLRKKPTDVPQLRLYPGVKSFVYKLDPELRINRFPQSSE